MKGQSSGSVRVSLVIFVFVLVLVSGCEESVCVQFPCGVFRYIEPHDIALRIDTACLCRDYVFPWKVDGSEVALSEQEPMSLTRRVGEKSNDLAGGINVTSIGHHGVWWIDHLSNSVVHHIGMEGSHVRKDYADDQPAVPRYSIVHAPKHGELLEFPSCNTKPCIVVGVSKLKLWKQPTTLPLGLIFMPNVLLDPGNWMEEKVPSGSRRKLRVKTDRK